MVSKVAVIALVAIVACPILLGYAMNLDQTTETDYRPSSDTVNATQMLQNGADYTLAKGDIYQMNTTFTFGGVLPEYKKFVSNKTSLELTKGGGIGGGSTQSFTGFNVFYYQVYSGTTSLSIYQIIGGTESLYATSNGLKSVYYEKNNPNHLIVIDSNQYNDFQTTGTFSKIIFNSTTTGMQLYDNGNTNSFVDISAGFIANTSVSGPLRITGQSAANKTMLLTINLDSITSSSYSFKIRTNARFDDYLLFSKTTVAGVVNWTVTNYSDAVQVESYDLYYDPTRSDNTYQYYITTEGIERSTIFQTTGDNRYTPELRYVGGWPSLIGKANYYRIYSFEPWVGVGTFDSLDSVDIDPIGSVNTPLMRVDEVTYKAMKYPIIENRTYGPSALKDNPITTINDIVQYGASIEFGGNTYTIDDGKITIGDRQISLDGLTFLSIPDSNGNYENKIGNTLISTTAQPSTIKFNGRWSANVTTASSESYTYTKTTWTPGHFGWDGIDHNFLMVGLITSIGVFIALGIYIRRTGASLWPVLLVCGGAAMLFFCML